MILISLAEEIGLQPKKCASTKGGEYKSSCPKCNDGSDRFCIWPNQGVQGKYWCRICNIKGDAIQFCKDFMGLTYIDACKRLNVEPRQINKIKVYNPYKENVFKPQIVPSTSKNWSERAEQFINYSHDNLLNNSEALGCLFNRGFTLDIIKLFKLGWNPTTVFDKRDSWGLETEYNEKGRERKQWLPKGIVIPSYENQKIVRIKIRRSEWLEGDKLPKYVEISGSFKRLPTYGDTTKPVVIVESELDAMLIQQFASDLCCCIALGGVGKRPDLFIHEYLKSASLILLSLDFDEAGKKECSFWMSLYSNLRPWPAGLGKSPGDSFALYKIDIKEWLIQGLKVIHI